MSPLKYWLWLTQLRGLKNQTRLRLLYHFGTPEAIFYADEEELLLTEGIDEEQIRLLSDHNTQVADRILGECQRLNIQLLTIQDAAYPRRLRNIFDPPCLLYIKGHLPALDDELVVAVVGTRTCTPYGLACAEKFSYGLTTGGAIVASGLARGIDSAASRGALRAGGVTLGLVANGLDVIYPKGNRELYEDIAFSGALISEYPPGTDPMPGHFPLRNRILSGISIGALIVEAPARSGALITAAAALEQGKDIFAVPGPIDAPSSRGCNHLIQEGATLVMDAQDILNEYTAHFATKLQPSLSIPPTPANPTDSKKTFDSSSDTNHDDNRDVRNDKKQKENIKSEQAAEKLPRISLYANGLTEDQITLLRLLNTEDRTLVDELIEESGLPVQRVLASLTILEIDGFIRQHSGKRYTRIVEIDDTDTPDVENKEISASTTTTSD